MAGEVLQHNLTHKHETVLGFTAFPVVYFRTFNGYLDLFFILAHSQLVRIALREMHVHFVAANKPSVRRSVAAAVGLRAAAHVIFEQKVMPDRVV